MNICFHNWIHIITQLLAKKNREWLDVWGMGREGGRGRKEICETTEKIHRQKKNYPNVRLAT